MSDETQQNTVPEPDNAQAPAAAPAAPSEQPGGSGQAQRPQQNEQTGQTKRDKQAQQADQAGQPRQDPGPGEQFAVRAAKRERLRSEGWEPYPVQLPITTDLSTAQEFLGDISPNMISDQGTAIGAAIDLARQSFSDRKDLGKAIIVLTDGENFEDNALEAAKAAKEAGIRINVVGVGTSEGGNIPTSGGPLTDETGNMVVTRFNPEMCQSLASVGAGVFVSSASQASVVKELKKQLDELPKGSVSGGSDSSAIEDYESWLWAAFILLILEFCIMGRRNKFLIRYNIFGHEK